MSNKFVYIRHLIIIAWLVATQVRFRTIIKKNTIQKKINIPKVFNVSHVKTKHDAIHSIYIHDCTLPQTHDYVEAT